MLRQVFCGVWFVAEIPGEGDCILAHFDRASDLAQVVRLDHETGYFYGPIVADVPTVDALLDLVRRAESGEQLDAKTVFQPLLHRFSSKFPISLFLDIIAPSLRGTRAKNGEALEAWLGKKLGHRELALPSNLLVLQERSDWIIQALVDGVVAEIPPAQLEASPDAALAHPHFASYPPACLYWLWRGYLLGEDDLVERSITLGRSSSARLVRDAATLVDDLRTGARQTLGSVAPAELRRKAALLVARMRDPFPERFEVGPILFERNDALARSVELREPTLLPLPERSADDEPWSHGRLTVLHPDGDWVLTTGMRRHPRAGRHPSIPGHQDVLLEVSRETGAARVLDSISPRACDAWYVTPDLIAVHDGATLGLHERHGDRTWLGDSIRLAQRRIWRATDGRTLVALGGLDLYSETGPQWTPASVELLRIDGRHLIPLGTAAVPLSIAAEHDGKLVLCDEVRSVAYEARGLERVADVDLDGSGVALRPTCFVEQEQDARVGPNAVLDALGAMDLSLESTGRHWLVLRGRPGNIFDVMAGDEGGVWPIEPALVGGNLYWDMLDAERALVTTCGGAHVVDLAAKTSRRVLELGNMPFVVKTHEGCAGIDGESLVVCRSTSDGGWPVARRVTIGAGAAVDWCYLDGRVLAIRRDDCPLIVLALRGDDIWLLGAAAPDGPLAGANIASVAAPNGFWRMLVTIDGKPTLEAHALERCWTRAVETRPPDVFDAIGDAPWRSRPIQILA